jgi:16S rRNA processing protein RimM
MAASGFVTIGEVVKAHGLTGELSVAHYLDSPFVLRDVARVYIKQEGKRPRKFPVASVRIRSGRVLMRLEGITGRGEAERYRGALLWARKRDLPGVSGDEVLVQELYGCSVYLPRGEYLGLLADVMTRTGQEVWIIRDRENREILVPAVDEFVEELDVESKRAVVNPPPGLLETYGVRPGREHPGNDETG